MKKVPSVALLCAGTISRSEVTKIPNLSRYLGPVKAISKRIASRASNTLRAGYPVGCYEEIAKASLILIAAPAEQALQFVAEMKASGVDWSGTCIVVTGSHLDSSVLSGLDGASAGSLHIVDLASGPPLCIIEGQDRAAKEVAAVVAAPKSRTIRVRHGDMANCFAALCLSSHCFIPLLDAGVQALCAAGVAPSEAADVVAALMERSLRTFAKAGRQAWSPVEREFMLEKTAKIRPANPALAGYYSAMFDLARAWMIR